MDMLAVMVFIAAMLACCVWYQRESRRFERDFKQHMAALQAQHARQRAALAQFSAIYDDWQSGRASHEQVEAAYDDYQRVCDGDEVQA